MTEEKSKHYTCFLKKPYSNGLAIGFNSEQAIDLKVSRITFYDTNGNKEEPDLSYTRLQVGPKKEAVLFCNFPSKNRIYRSVQMMLFDDSHEEAYAVTIYCDGSVNSKRI